MGLRRLTYHRRLFLALVAYSLVLMGVTAVFQYRREKEFKVQELDMRLQDINSEILTAIARGDSVVPAELARDSRLEGLRVSIIDSTGRVIHDNTLDRLPQGSHLDRSEIADALRSGHGMSLRRHSESTGQTYFYSATRGGRFIVRTAVPYNVTLHQLLRADYGFLWTMAAITALMCLIGYFATRRLGQNVVRLNSFARKAELGERIIDTEPFPHDELGEISSHIVRLYARLQQALADRDREHRAALRAEHDKNRIKRELTNNINHELKTPVAAMQVCLDTLMAHPDMDPQRRADFIARCHAANERLGRLLTDVSSITRLDDGGASIPRSAVDVAAVAAEVADEFAVEAERLCFTIDNRIGGSHPVEGNEQLLASVFRNLIANALAYSGGSIITLDAVESAGRLTVSVADNGSGVDPAHLERIFERFYRVDKGRSRRAGGTGLGLSIVRNAVAWHGGTVRADNRLSGGLRVSFTLPI